MPRDAAYMFDILESSRSAIRYASEMDEAAFREDVKTQDAVIRRIELIREAAGRLSDGLIAKYPQLPIREMVGMRNRLIHEYDGIDISLVWQTVKIELPILTALVREEMVRE